jgi:hypothetical protein
MSGTPLLFWSFTVYIPVVPHLATNRCVYNLGFRKLKSRFIVFSNYILNLDFGLGNGIIWQCLYTNQFHGNGTSVYGFQVLILE